MLLSNIGKQPKKKKNPPKTFFGWPYATKGDEQRLFGIPSISVPMAVYLKTNTGACIGLTVHYLDDLNNAEVGCSFCHVHAYINEHEPQKVDKWKVSLQGPVGTPGYNIPAGLQRRDLYAVYPTVADALTAAVRADLLPSSVRPAQALKSLMTFVYIEGKSTVAIKLGHLTRRSGGPGFEHEISVTPQSRGNLASKAAWNCYLTDPASIALEHKIARIESKTSTTLPEVEYVPSKTIESTTVARYKQIEPELKHMPSSIHVYYRIVELLPSCAEKKKVQEVVDAMPVTVDTLATLLLNTLTYDSVEAQMASHSVVDKKGNYSPTLPPPRPNIFYRSPQKPNGHRCEGVLRRLELYGSVYCYTRVRGQNSIYEALFHQLDVLAWGWSSQDELNMLKVECAADLGI